MTNSNEPEPSTQLYLIRHAEGVVNVNPTIVGPSGDLGLTDLGVQQAERLRDRLAATHEIAADVLLASPLPRARQTAQIIAPALGLAVEYDDDLQEFRLGDDLDGMSIEEFDAKYPTPDYRKEPFSLLTPGSENWPQFALRVGSALNRLIHQHNGKRILIITHGGFVDASFVYFFGLPSLSLPPAGLYTENTSITHWGQDLHSPYRIWRLYRYNDDVHLRGLDSGKAINWPDLPLPPADERFTPPSPPGLGKLGRSPEQDNAED